MLPRRPQRHVSFDRFMFGVLKQIVWQIERSFSTSGFKIPFRPIVGRLCQTPAWGRSIGVSQNGAAG
jgi:hypothetical protein